MARVLIDACLPARLRKGLPGHEVATAHHLGWENLDDAELLRAMSGRFDVLITADKSLPLQQNEARAKVAVIVLRSPRIRLDDLLPALPEILAVLEKAQPGEAHSIQLPTG